MREQKSIKHLNDEAGGRGVGIAGIYGIAALVARLYFEGVGSGRQCHRGGDGPIAGIINRYGKKLIIEPLHGKRLRGIVNIKLNESGNKIICEGGEVRYTACENVKCGRCVEC